MRNHGLFDKRIRCNHGPKMVLYNQIDHRDRRSQDANIAQITLAMSRLFCEIRVLTHVSPDRRSHTMTNMLQMSKTGRDILSGIWKQFLSKAQQKQQELPEALATFTSVKSNRRLNMQHYMFVTWTCLFKFHNSLAD